VPYNANVKIGSTAKVLATVAALLVIGTGCGGFYAAPSVSPLTFLPLFAQSKQAPEPSPAPGHAATNWNAALAN
jgi:hypothetical protein